MNDCQGCMFQRFVMTDDGQKWFCRHPDSDGKYHRGDELFDVCPYKPKKG